MDHNKNHDSKYFADEMLSDDMPSIDYIHLGVDFSAMENYRHHNNRSLAYLSS